MSIALPTPPEHPRSLVYFGSPDAAVPPLLKLVEAGFEIPLVVSMPPIVGERVGQLRSDSGEEGCTGPWHTGDRSDFRRFVRRCRLRGVVAYGQIIVWSF